VRSLIGGALAMGYAVAALFFLRFWHQSRDRLFAAFATAFAILAAQRTAINLAAAYEWDTTWAYLMRLAAFVILLYAIFDKNRAR
jgi:hypothetical protein